jgi:hypothetical protein
VAARGLHQVPIVLGQKWIVDHPARDRGVEPEERLVFRPDGAVGAANLGSPRSGPKPGIPGTATFRATSRVGSATSDRRRQRVSLGGQTLPSAKSLEFTARTGCPVYSGA